MSLRSLILSYIEKSIDKYDKLVVGQIMENSCKFLSLIAQKWPVFNNINDKISFLAIRIT